VHLVAPELADEWGRLRQGEADGLPIVTSCGGCVSFLGRRTPTWHVLDLLVAPESTVAGQARAARFPFTYINRLRVKRQLKNRISSSEQRERPPMTGNGSNTKKLLVTVLMVLLLAAAIIAVRVTGLTDYLEQERLRTLIASFGPLAPLIYILIYSLAPALFLPGLPLTVVGGLLFGPIWGVVYAIIGATIGASIAFLVARYLARGWVEGKLTSPRWQELDRQVAKEGWKVVAFTRLIPLFPFNLLNYAFGLTKISFSHYALASFLFMLPACIAFVVFSSSLLDLLRGKVTREFFFGIALIGALSLLPVLYRKWQRREGPGGRP
jgi:uncharacterized membrane protein YdjX (TVP38/TMEM64 family)